MLIKDVAQTCSRHRSTKYKVLYCITLWCVLLPWWSCPSPTVSKVTTHLHCSHGHHIYHLVHGIHWLANQRRITHDDVRWAQPCLSQNQWKHDESSSYKWKDSVTAASHRRWWLTEKSIVYQWLDQRVHGMRWIINKSPGLMIWYSQLSCHTSSQPLFVLLQLRICIIELGPSSCSECYISSNYCKLCEYGSGATVRHTAYDHLIVCM